jgi:hypothetical protein
MTQTERALLLEQYRAGAAEVDEALAGITAEELDRRPPEPDGWTARQVAHHLADSEAMAYTRLRRLIAGYDEPVWANRLHYDRPIEASVAVMRAVREASVQLLEAIDEQEWSRMGTHTESGPYSVEGWLRIYASHPHEHAEQIRAARGG